jgi:arylsulfatase A
MILKRILIIAALGLLAMSAHQAAAKPTNIVLILADDLGWVDVGCYGSTVYRTPNIDRLASQGMRFTDAYANAGLCSPSRAAILTGKHPARLHITDWIPGHPELPANPLKIPEWRKYLPLSEEVLPEPLGAAGYTSANVGKWHLGNIGTPVEHGFDVNVAGGVRGSPPGYFWPYGQGNAGYPGLRATGARGEYITDRLTTEAIAFMREHREGPFFLYLPHHAVHVPLQAKPEKIEENAKRLKGTDVHTTYAAMIESLDESVGAVVQALDELGVENETLLVFTSDNGGFWPDATSNAPLRAGKVYPYEGGIRVPFIARFPGVIEAGSVCNVPVVGADLFPTFLEVAGAKRDDASTEPLYGKSIIPLLKQSGGIERDALHWHYPHYWHGRRVQPHGIVRTGDWKLIEFYEDMRVELYNLADDLGEKNDLAKSNPEKAGQLREMLHKFRNEVGAQMPTRKATAPE